MPAVGRFLEICVWGEFYVKLPWWYSVISKVKNWQRRLIYKILSAHLVEGRLAAGEQVGIRIDQTLTQDATGTTAFLLFESIGAAPRQARGRQGQDRFVGQLHRPQYGAVRA